MIRGAIFDADGTLLDTMPMWEAITYEYPASLGVPVPEGLHRTMNRLSLEQCAALYRQLGVPGSIEKVVQDLGAWAFAGYRDRVSGKPCAGEFLRLLHGNGVHVAVATASQEEGVACALERCGMLPCVDFLITCTKLGKSKEHPDIFLRCAAEFDCRPGESVVFEDSLYAIETAKRAGFPVVAVADSSSAHEAQAIQALADRYIQGYHELIRELLPPEGAAGAPCQG